MLAVEQCANVKFCFAAHLLESHYKCLKKCVVKWPRTKCRFMSVINIFMMVMLMSVMSRSVAQSD
jgi:hypothetical protein